MKLSKKHPIVITVVLGLVLGASLYGILTLNRAIDTYDSEVTPTFEQSVAADMILVDFKFQVQEWKNVLLRGGDLEQRETHWASFLETEASIRKASAQLLDELPEGNARSLVQEFANAHVEMGVDYRRGLDHFEAAGSQAWAGDATVKGVDRAPSDLLSKASESLKQRASAASTSASTKAREATTISLSIMFFSSFVALCGAIRFSRSITRSILNAVDVAHLIAAGDLSQKIDVKGNDETAELLRALRDMQNQLAGVVRTVRDNADNVASSTEEIVRANLLNSSQSEEQSRALSETSGSIKDLETVTRQNTDRIGKANVLATGASGSASRGGEAVNDVVNTMHGINDSASRIADITSVIDDIAFQTNILALNAAVEAARAGEEGRGFAVVASEVRVLAQRSADAAREIKALISESVQHVSDGTNVVNETGKTMIDLVGTIGDVTQIMSEVTDASQHQNQSVMQASQSIKAIEEALHGNSERVDRSTEAAESLNRQAMDLVNSVAVFRIPKTMIGTSQSSPMALAGIPSLNQHVAGPKGSQQGVPNYRDAA